MQSIGLPLGKKLETAAEVGESVFYSHNRSKSALNYLMRSPFISMPPMPNGERCKMFDERFPIWLRKAIGFADQQHNDSHYYGEILWEVYSTAMTAKPNSPWKKQSRPRKAKEKFIQALMARKAKTP